jgi:hypothetical protein
MTDDPVPAYFSFRYVVWLGWSNAITILATLQAVFATITLDPTLMSPTAFHWCSIANLIFIVVVAQIKRNTAPSLPPTTSGQSK